MSVIDTGWLVEKENSYSNFKRVGVSCGVKKRDGR